MEFKKRMAVAHCIIIATATAISTWALGCSPNAVEEDASDWLDIPEEWPMASSYPPGPVMTIRLPDSVNSTRASSKDQGTFWRLTYDDYGISDPDSGQEVEFDNGYRLCWRPGEAAYPDSTVELRFLNESGICGYAIVRIAETDNGFALGVVKCARFVDGSGKSVTVGASEVDRRVSAAIAGIGKP